jgi:hypothetical protein
MYRKCGRQSERLHDSHPPQEQPVAIEENKDGLSVVTLSELEKLAHGIVVAYARDAGARRRGREEIQDASVPPITIICCSAESSQIVGQGAACSRARAAEWAGGVGPPASTRCRRQKAEYVGRPIVDWK